MFLKRYYFTKTIVFYCLKCKKTYEYKTNRYNLTGSTSVKHTIIDTIRKSEIISFDGENKSIILKPEENYITDKTGILLQPVCPECKINLEKFIMIAMDNKTFKLVLKELL
jgi:ribosomal protein L44E